MGKGGVKKIVDIAKDPVSSLTDFANIVSNVTTLGLVGVGDKGGIKPGIVSGGALQLVDEGLGEITGRNLAREQAGKAEDRIRQEEANIEKEKKERQVVKEREARQASGAAAALTSVPGTRRRGSTFNRRTPVKTNKSSLGAPEDFLGI